MKVTLYGLINGIISIGLFEIINSVDILNKELSMTLYLLVTIVGVVLSFINYELTKQVAVSEYISFSVFSIMAFLLSFFPSIIITGILLNSIINLIAPVKLIQDDMGAGVLMIVIFISYGIGMILAYLLCFGYRFLLNRYFNRSN